MQFADDYIIEILRQLPSECAYLDYKQIPYLKNNFHELIKDVIAMLNSEEAFGIDKAIIFGVTDDPRELRGIEAFLSGTQEKFDDANYQTIFDYIYPRPVINVGSTNFHGHTFGFVFMPADKNTNWVYEVKKNYIGNKTSIKCCVSQGQAFYRRGSKNYIMMQEDRERIKGISVVRPSTSYRLTVVSPSEKSLDSLTIAAVMGSWCEENQYDRSVIEAIFTQDYENWIEPLRKLRESGAPSVSFDNNVWKVNNPVDIFKSAGIQLYDIHFDLIEKQIINVFSDVDTKYDLEQDQRYAAGVYVKAPKYSYNIRDGLSEFLAILGNFPSYFSSCSAWKTHKLIKDIIARLFAEDDWRVIATMQEYSSLLAEANPAAFSQEVQANIKKSTNGIIRYLSEKETGIYTTHYGHPLVYALGLTACRQEFFSNACYTIFLISKYNKEFLQSLTAILLPWKPHTEAPVEQRVSIVKQFIKEDILLAWELLLSLLPGETTISLPFHPPKYLSSELKNSNDVAQTYWLESNGYLKLAIEAINGDTKRLLDLIAFLDDVPKEIFNNILEAVKKTITATSTDDDRYPIWNELLRFSCRHRQFADADWALPEEALNEIDLTAESIAPLSRQVRMRRLFQEDSSEILPSLYEDYQEEEATLASLRKIELQWCYNTYGLDELVKCIQCFERTDDVGIYFAEMDFTAECDRNVCRWLSSDIAKLVQMAQNYIAKRFHSCNYTWAKELLVEQSQQTISDFLSLLPIISDTWDLVYKLLDEANIGLYWEQVPVWRLPENSNAEIVVQKLLQYNRSVDAIELISRQHHSHRYLPPEIVFNALQAVIDHQSKGISQHNSYSIIKLIKWLQDNWNDKKNLLLLEWQYLNLLDADSSVTPKNLFNEISSNPEKFMEILCLAFKGHNEPKRELTDEQMKIAKHCNRLLFQWKTVPGSDGNGYIDINALNTWFKAVKEKSIAVDRYQVAMQFVGAALFHSPVDPDGLFINHAVAEILHSEEDESIRTGYNIEAFNSRGVQYIDPTGTPEFALEQQYEERAKQIDKLGLFRFAEALRKLAKEYHWEAINNIEEAKKWSQEDIRKDKE